MYSESLEKYQIFTEKTIFDLSQQLTFLEKKLNIVTNLLEISKYINQYIKDQHLLSLINDMLIGVFGARYSTIYIKSEDEYIASTPKNFSYTSIEEEKNLILTHQEKEFILNSDKPIYETSTKEDNVFSCLGVPIQVDNRILGFILIQHQEKSYFSKDHAYFLSSLTNHIAVAIENNILYNQIKESAYKDGLTGIFNKRYFFDTINAMTNLSDENYSIVMVDIDNFKLINDTYGHLYGDIVLKTIASIIKNATRPNDIVARYGGEEMIIFFYRFTDLEKVSERVEFMRSTIENTIIPSSDNSASVTASFGVHIKNNQSLSLDQVIKKADDNLYICKRTGKNKVFITQ